MDIPAQIKKLPFAAAAVSVLTNVRYLKRIVLAAVILALLTQVGLSIWAVIEEADQCEQVTARADDLAEGVQRNNLPVPVRNPGEFSGRALDHWVNVHNRPKFAAASFYDDAKPEPAPKRRRGRPRRARR